MELRFPVILDGATGTELQKRGYTGGICSEQWVLDHPEAIIEIQRGYIDAGSNIIYAPTFGANRVKLEENGIFNQVRDYNLRLVALSKEAAGDRAYVAGDMAPTGKFLAPLGDMTFEELVEVYREQAAALEEAGVDLFVIETMMTVPEARAAVLAVKSVSKKPVFVSFTCDENGRTLTGTDVTAALLIMQGMGVDAFGLNCSVGPEDMLKQLRRLQPYAEVPLIAKPNAGMPEVVDGKTVYRCTPDEFTACTEAFAAAGVAIFGGCCGTHAGHIKALSDTVMDVQIPYPDAAPKTLLPLATEKAPALLPADVRCGVILECSDALGDQLEEIGENGDTVTAIRISTEEQLDDFADFQYAITRPLCILTEDAHILEQALRCYQGRAMYEGNLPEETLGIFGKKYGLIY
ncbi:MAG: homocysteine S-methyltransferase family protein [Oscillospiraceae bacterium]|nr:homocysteine S-methyltransferase family protein [Oscillospiraceae bacterium]